MKTLSVLFTFALLVAANQLAVHLKRANALPARSPEPMAIASTHFASLPHTSINQ